MALAQRRGRAATATVSAIAAVAVAVAVYGRGCNADGDSPEAIAREYLAATRAGDAAAIYELLSSETRAELAHAARRAEELVGGERRFTPIDMINPPAPDEGAAAPTLSERERSAGRVVFDVGGDPPLPLVVVRESDGWRVHVSDYRGGGAGREVPGPQLDRLGPTPEHRRSFAPVRLVIEGIISR